MKDSIKMWLKIYAIRKCKAYFSTNKIEKIKLGIKKNNFAQNMTILFLFNQRQISNNKQT